MAKDKKKESTKKTDDTVTFYSNKINHVVTMVPGVMGDEKRKGKRIKFQSGEYTTSDKQEIAFLRKKAKERKPYVKVWEGK